MFINVLLICSFCSNSRRASDEDHSVVSENDLDHFLHLLDGKDGELSWQSMMERNTPNMAYQAWRYEPEVKEFFDELLIVCFLNGIEELVFVCLSIGCCSSLLFRNIH